MLDDTYRSVMRRLAKNFIYTALVIMVVVALIQYYHAMLSPPREEGLPEEALPEWVSGWSVNFTVNGEFIRTYNYSELSLRASPLNVTVHDKEITIQAVPLTSLLEENGIDPGSIGSFRAKGSDGYVWNFDGGHVHDAYIQVVEKEFLSHNGPLRIVVIGARHKSWVKFLVEIGFETLYE